MPNKIDRNALSGDRLRRTIQRISQGAVSSTLLNTIGVIAPITGGGSIKNNPSIGISKASSTTNGYLSSTDWNTFNGKQAAGSYLSTATQLGTTAPVQGGGYLSTGLTISMPQAGSTTNGWLSSTDWNAFHAGGGGGSTTIIAADASILIGTSTGSTTVQVQEQSGRGISTGSSGVGILLGDHPGTTVLASQDFTTLAQGTSVGLIGGAGTTWAPWFDGGTNGCPGGTQSNAYITVNGSTVPRSAGWALTANSFLLAALYIPSTATGTVYTESMVAQPANTSTGGGGVYGLVGLFVRANHASPDGTGVLFRFFLDKMDVQIGAGVSTSAATAYPQGTLTGMHTFAVSVNGNNMTASVDGSTIATYTISNYATQSGVGFTVGGYCTSTGTNGGVQSWQVIGGPFFYSGLTLTPPNLAILIPSTSVLYASTAGLDITQATTSTSGYLSSTDWNTFNNKASYSAVYAFRNRLINGNFDFWQRGTLFGTGGGPAAPCYTADRWYLSSTVGGGLNGCSATQQAFGLNTLGSTTTPYTYFVQLSSGSNAGATGYAMLEQRIESVKTLAGQPAVLSFWIKPGTVYTPSVAIIQNFGTGGSPTSQITVSTLNWGFLAANWQFISTAINVPTISTATLGTNGNDYLSVQFIIPTNVVLNIARVQLEPGTNANDFEYRPLSLELSLCQRYFSKSYQLTDAPGTTTHTGEIRYPAFATGIAEQNVTVFYPNTMRTVPTLTFYSSVTGAANNIADLTAGTDLSMPVASLQGTRSHSGGSALTANHVYAQQYAVSAEL